MRRDCPSDKTEVYSAALFDRHCSHIGTSWVDHVTWDRNRWPATGGVDKVPEGTCEIREAATIRLTIDDTVVLRGC